MKEISIGLVIGATLANSVGSTFRSLDKTIGQLQEKTNNVKVKIDAGEQYKNLRAETLKLSADMQAGKLDAAGIQRLKELKAATLAAGEEAKKYGLSLGSINKQLETMRDYSKHQEGFLARAQARVQRREERSEMRGQLAGTMAVGAAMFAYPLKAAADFEQAMAEVGAISRSNTEDMAKLTENAREMGRTTKFSATEAAMGQKYLAMAGFKTHQIVATMPGMLDLAAAANMDLARTADIASNILTGFGMDATEMTRVANVMALAFSSSNTNVEQLGYAMKYAAPISKTLGFSIEETAAIVSKLSDAGIQGQMAGTALRGMLDSLTAPTKKAQDLLDALHIKTIDKNGELRALPDVIRDLDTAMSREKLGSAQRAGVVQELFGTRAGTGANAIWDAVLSGDLEKLTQKYISEQDGAVKEMARRMNETAKGSLIQLGSAMESVGIDIGNVLLPPLKDTAQALAGVVGQASEFLQKYPGVTKLAVGLAAGFVGLKAATLATRIGWSHVKDGASIAMDVFQRLRPSVLRNALEMARLSGSGGALKGMFSSLGSGIKAFGAGAAADLKAAGAGFKALWGGIAGHPLAIGGLMAVAGAVYLVWKNWDDVSKAWSEGWAKITADLAEGNVAQAFIDLGATIGASLKPVLDDILTPMASVLGGIVQKIGQAVGGVGKAIESGLEKTGLGLSEEGKINGYDYSQSADMWTWNGGAGAGSVIADQNASGGLVERPTLSWIGEDGPEFIVPVGGAYRERGKSLLAGAASALGMTVTEKSAPGLAPAPQNGPQNGAQNGAQSGPQNGGINCQITINAAPGMDVRALADEVLRRIEEYQARRQRGSYGDDAFAR